MFRLDRIDDLRVLDEPAKPPPDISPRDVRGGVFQPSADHELVVLRLSPPARWVADFYPTESVAEQPGGDLVVHLRAADRSWVRRLVLGLGAAVSVVAPASLAEDVRAVARAALSAYREEINTQL